MYITQAVDHVVGYVDEEQRDDGVELFVLWEPFQEVALDELDGLVWQVVRHRHGGVPRGGVGLVSPFGNEGVQSVLVEGARVVCEEVVGQDGSVV